jgi:PLP dependent protein
MIAHNLKSINERIHFAAEKAGVNPCTIKLVAVTKTVSPDRIQLAFDAGHRVFGENKVQEALTKISKVNRQIEWHFIGHLQSNKVKQVIGRFELIHSVDSTKLAEMINLNSEQSGAKQKILLQVNVANEESKFGFQPKELPQAVERVLKLPNLSLLGLMTIPPFLIDPEMSRPYFIKLKKLSEKLPEWGWRSAGGQTELSMGMSDDFEVAIDEGATLIRIGTALFGER